MSLEDILWKTKAVITTAKEDLWDRPDEWIRKQYLKVVTEEREVFHYANMFLEGGIYLAMIISAPYYAEALKYDHSALVHSHVFAVSSSPLLIFELVANRICKHNEHRRNFATLDEKESKSNVYIPKWIQKTEQAIRFPYIIATLLYFGEHMATEIITIPGVGYSLAGISMAGGIVSSMYLKDRDPKQFQKRPFWERGYDYVKERVEEMLPQPTPIPIPVRRYASLEPATSL